jgi:NAD(P)-dependent dehydrogenase (short-subunit alcohol dehydrogenase family)
MRRLDGRVALVTGATRGVGEAIARRFAAEGASVVLVGRGRERGSNVVASIESAGGSAAFFAGDVSSEADVAAAVQHAVERFGGLHILVNNAIPTDQMAANVKPLHEYTLEQFEGILRVALSGTFLTIKYGVPEMLRAGGGSIVNISTMASIMGMAGLPAYSTAKGGMNALTRYVAAEYGKQGVRCNAIIPGILANEANSAVTAIPALQAAIESQHLVPELGRNEDVAALAAYLASDEARFVTGAQYVIDGGFSIRTDSIKEMAEASFGAAS